jgi:hypothetical protein
MISLLSILDKVYAILLMHKVSKVVEPKLLDAQCGFCSSRGTIDAMFVLHQLANMAELTNNTQLHMAFIDLTRAYDWVNRDVLWRILHIYKVPSKIVQLLEDLHVGTLATVRLGGQVGKEFTVNSSVRQGCVVVPLLFNVFLDFVVRQALADMPEDAGVSVGYRGDGRILFERRAKRDLTLHEISLLLYVDDMVLFSTKPENLMLMLKAMDSATKRFTMRINASKTKIMSVGKGMSQLPVDVTISSGPFELID